jgi:hypothetical protein
MHISTVKFNETLTLPIILYCLEGVDKFESIFRGILIEDSFEISALIEIGEQSVIVGVCLLDGCSIVLKLFKGWI